MCGTTLTGEGLLIYPDVVVDVEIAAYGSFRARFGGNTTLLVGAIVLLLLLMILMPGGDIVPILER